MVSSKSLSERPRRSIAHAMTISNFRRLASLSMESEHAAYTLREGSALRVLECAQDGSDPAFEPAFDQDALGQRGADPDFEGPLQLSREHGGNRAVSSRRPVAAVQCDDGERALRGQHTAPAIANANVRVGSLLPSKTQACACLARSSVW